MNDRNDNIKEMSESQNKNSVINDGDNNIVENKNSNVTVNNNVYLFSFIMLIVVVIVMLIKILTILSRRSVKFMKGFVKKLIKGFTAFMKCFIKFTKITQITSDIFQSMKKGRLFYKHQLISLLAFALTVVLLPYTPIISLTICPAILLAAGLVYFKSLKNMIRTILHIFLAEINVMTWIFMISGSYLSNQDIISSNSITDLCAVAVFLNLLSTTIMYINNVTVSDLRYVKGIGY